jgi:glycerophosphoryl diester phosphodiesterase
VLVGIVLAAVVATSTALVPPLHPPRSRIRFAAPLHDRPLPGPVADLVGLRTVAHNVNAIAALRTAVERGAPIVEVDVIVADGRLYARHDPVPASVGWSVPAPALADVWEALGPETAVHLDLKPRGERAASLVAGFLLGHPAREVAVSSPDPSTLAALRERDVDASLLLSVRSGSELERLAGERTLSRLVDGVTIREDLLDETTFGWLSSDGLRVVAWTVDDPERARELAAMGVVELTTDSLALIGALSGVVAEAPDDGGIVVAAAPAEPRPASWVCGACG